MPAAEYILIVDSDRDLTMGAQTLLNSCDYPTSVCHDGATALKICQEKLPKVLILEGMLPKMNGLELARKVRDLPGGGLVSILLISFIYAGLKFRAEVEKAGIDEVLPKPFTPTDLLARVRALEVTADERSKRIGPASTQTFEYSGSLLGTPFIRIVHYLYSSKESGALRLNRGTTKKLVTFEKGEPKWVVSNLEKECLGQLLVAKGRISSEDLERSLQIMRKEKKLQGRVLTEMGLLQPFEVEDALKQQAREKFCEIFAWRNGRYLFVPGMTFQKDLMPVDLNVEQLCLRGVKEHYTLKILKDTLQPYMSHKTRISDPSRISLENFRFATWDQKLIPFFKDGKTLIFILAQKVAREIDVYHLFYTLYMLGVLEFEQQHAESSWEEQAERLSPFEILGVSQDAKDPEIRRIFEEKQNELSAKFPGNENVLRILNQAYEKVGMVQGRRDYFLRIYVAEGELPSKAQEIFKPEDFISVGDNFLESKLLSRARKAFQDGLSFFPKNPRLISFYGLTIIMDPTSKNNPAWLERGKKALLKSVQLAPRDADVYYNLAQLFCLEKNYEEARKVLEKTLSLNPGHSKADNLLGTLKEQMNKKQNSSFLKWKF